MENPYAKYAQPKAQNTAPPPFIAGTPDPYKNNDEARKNEASSNDNARLGIAETQLAMAQAKDAREVKVETDKIEADELKVSTAKAATASKLRRILAQLGSIRKDAEDNGGWFETGTSGAIARAVLPAGQAGPDLLASLKTINAENAFSALQALGEQGVKLTPISNVEIGLAADSVANLDPNQGHETFLKSINVAQTKYSELLNSIAPEALAKFGYQVPASLTPDIQEKYPEASLFYFGMGEDSNDDWRDNIVGYDKADGEHVSLTPNGDGPPTGGGTGGSGLGDAFVTGVGDLAEGAGEIAGLVSNPLNAVINTVFGTNLGTDLGAGARQATGIPQGGSPLARAINKGGIGAIAPAGLANALARGGTNIGRSVVTNALAQQPIQQGVGGAGAGLAAEAVNQAGGGPVLQAGAALAGGLSSFSAANRFAQRGTAPVVNALAATGPGTATKASQNLVPNAAQIARDGDAAGLRVMTSDVRPPTTRIGKLTRTMGENIPLAGTAGPRAKQQTERGDVVRKLMKDFGADDASIDAVSADLIKTRGAMIGKLTDAKKSVIENVKGNVPAPTAIAEIDKQIAKLKGIDDTAFDPVVKRLEGFKTALQSGKSLEQVEGQRKLLGDLFSDPSLASIKGDGQKAINAIYEPLRKDMGDFIGATAGPEARSKWEGANERLSAMMGELDASAFKGLLNKAETTPESAAKIIFGKTPSDMRRLYGSLSDKGKAKAQSAILFQAAEKSTTNDVISPQKFATAMEAMSKSTGVFFSPADKARIDGMTRLIKATQQASEAAASPMTGAQNTPFLAGISLAQVFGTAALPATAGAGLLARVYESKPVRDAFLRLGQTKAGTPQEKRAVQGVISSIAAANDNGGNFVANMPSSPAAAAAQTDDVND